MNCPKCGTTTHVKKNGHFRRKSDCRVIQRFACKACQLTYSTATDDPAFGHKKRRINYELRKLLGSNISMRRAAIILNVHQTTIARKLKFLGQVCANELAVLQGCSQRKVMKVQFDELHTIEHTKCKPLAVAVAVDSDTREILGVEVSQMPASGHLAKIARKKYGYREDTRRKGIKTLFMHIKDRISDKAQIRSDEHPYYSQLIQRHFPGQEYQQFKGEMATVAGQGELKKAGRDPLFQVNHALAMLRANINRLIRRTWCTTKDPARLKDHLMIYCWFHNTTLAKVSY